MNDADFPRRYTATPDGLEVARRIAEALGTTFDPDATRRASTDLHDRYFAEVCQVVGVEVSGAKFVSGSHFRVNAFVPSGSNVVHLDEVLDHWLFTCCHLTTIAACKQLPSEEYESLTRHFLAALDMTRNAHIHDALRHHVLPLMLNHADCLELSHALSRAMVVFVICHECAHIAVGHASGPSTPNQEFEADAAAARYFGQIVRAKESAGSIFVSEKLASAPLLLFRLLQLAESRAFTATGHTPSRKSHPSPTQRLARLEPVVTPDLSERARYVLEGLTASLDDIERLAQLVRPTG